MISRTLPPRKKTLDERREKRKEKFWQTVQ